MTCKPKLRWLLPLDPLPSFRFFHSPHLLIFECHLDNLDLAYLGLFLVKFGEVSRFQACLVKEADSRVTWILM